MTSKAIFKTLTIFLMCSTLWTCKKDKIVCTDEKTFCALVDEQNFDATGQIIDGFLGTLKYNYDTDDYKKHEENLENLKDWLECKSCVDRVEILCNSCIYTLPPQSELRIDFISNGQTIKMTLDILMGDKLKFRAYH